MYVVVGSKTTFDGSSLDGFSAGNASVVIQNGEFNGNGNVGFQNTGVTSKLSVINGGSFNSNGAGISVYTRLVVNAGDFSDNSSYGAENPISRRRSTAEVSPTINSTLPSSVEQLRSMEERFLTPVTAQASFITVGDTSNIVVYGTFAQYGTFASDLSFAGTLAAQSVSQNFTYLNVGGSITLAQSVTVAAPSVPVPEAPTVVPPCHWLAAHLLGLSTCGDAKSSWVF